MKKFGPIVRFLYPWSGLAERVGYIISISVGVVIGMDEDADWLNHRPVVLRAIEFVKDDAFYFYLASLALIVFSFCVKRYGKPWVWDKLKFILDEYRGKAFFVSESDPQDHHRITLFQYKRNCVFKKHWSSSYIFRPWGNTPLVSHYLVPVLRSGHLSQKTSAIFHVPDSGDHSEGVAGWAFAARSSVVIQELPDVNKKQAPKYIKNNYAEATKCPREMIEHYISKDRMLPRSIAAIPVDVHGKPWGVIVLDSRTPNGVQEQSVLNYSLTVALIGQLLEEA
ncbi:hypothetical protein RVM27_14215 [Halomonas sp. KM007]